MLSLEPLVRKAIYDAVAKQKALGLPNYYTNKNGKIYACLLWILNSRSLADVQRLN